MLLFKEDPLKTRQKLEYSMTEYSLSVYSAQVDTYFPGAYGDIIWLGKTFT